jgi:hypothetical protein
LVTAQVATGDAKDKEYQLGVKFPMGASNLYFGYANSKVNVAGAERAKANGYVLAATYSLSKRTTAYAGYTTAKRTRNLGVAGQGKRPQVHLNVWYPPRFLRTTQPRLIPLATPHKGVALSLTYQRGSIWQFISAPRAT